MVQESQNWQQFLAQTQLFQGLSQQEIQAITQIAVAKAFFKGENIFWEGEPCDGFYLIKKGKVKIFQLSSLGKEQILHIFERGGHFAEVSAFDGKCFPASAIAMTKTELLFFPRVAFLRLLEKHPTLAINMLAIFARHLRRFARLIEDLSLKEVPGRLAVYLLELRERNDNLDGSIPILHVTVLRGTETLGFWLLWTMFLQNWDAPILTDSNLRSLKLS